MISKPELGQRLRKIREERGLSRAAVDYKGCVSENGLDRIERGEVYPSLKSFMALMKLYKIELPEVLK